MGLHLANPVLQDFAFQPFWGPYKALAPARWVYCSQEIVPAAPKLRI